VKKIFIVEDMTLMRDALTKIINGQEDMRVIGFTADAEVAFDLCRKLAPDLALIDVVTHNKANGIAAASAIRLALPDIKIVIMTSLPEITFLDAARKAGAHSFVYKDTDSEHLLHVIRNTLNGRGTYPGPGDEVVSKTNFSDVDIAIIRLFCQGKSRNEIALALHMTEANVKVMITGILNKTGFDSMMKFSVYAVARGFIVPGPNESP
jgi:DNA-binding NarL/FixJ family response regulator